MPGEDARRSAGWAEGLNYATIPQPYRHHCPVRQGERGHRSDHPQTVSEAHRAHRIRRIPVLRLARFGRRKRARKKDRRFCALLAALSARLDTYRAEIHRLQYLASALQLGVLRFRLSECD